MVIDKVEQYFDDVHLSGSARNKYSKKDIAKIMIDRARVLANYWKDISL